MAKLGKEEFNWENDNDDEDEPWKKAHNEWKDRVDHETHALISPQQFDLAWDESAWEVFMQSTDKEGLRVIAFYEKYWSHSDRDRMVEEAMAMYYVREAYKQMYPGHFKEKYFKFYLERELTDMGIFEEGFQGFLDAKENSLYRIPAYRYARDFYHQVRAWMFTLREDIRREKLLEDFSNHAGTTYTKLAGGHVMGYQPHTLGGNIAECKRALRAMNRCFEYLSQIKAQEWLDQEKYLYLEEIALEARNAVGIRIVDLRDQFFELIRH
jgi:hypothetical protein